jgi:hypothetical protein
MIRKTIVPAMMAIVGLRDCEMVSFLRNQKIRKHTGIRVMAFSLDIIARKNKTAAHVHFTNSLYLSLINI